MNTALETSKYQVNDIDKIRIKPLLNQVSTTGIEFKYLVTIDYWFPMKTYNRVVKDCSEDRRLIRSFFKSDIKVWSFIELHTDHDQKNYGGYHRHHLVSEIPRETWLNPTPRMEKWMLEVDPEMVFSVKFGVEPTPQQKMELVKKVLRKLQPNSVAQGGLGIDMREIYDLEGVLSYCSKQFEHYHPSYEVIAPTSDINLKHFIENKQYGLNYRGRPQTISSGTY